jgi:peptidoglycan hydrolase-like protein with peptidoglycan-binding domain
MHPMDNPRLAIGFTVSRILLTGVLLVGGSSCAIESATDETAGEATDTIAEDVMASATPQCVSIALRFAISPPINDPSAGYLIPVAGNGSSQCLLSQGAHNVAVARLQLAMQDCYGASVGVDGDFGPQTKQALILVQRINGLTADGIYGPQTHSRVKFAMSPDEFNPVPNPPSAFCAVTAP